MRKCRYWRTIVWQVVAIIRSEAFMKIQSGTGISWSASPSARLVNVEKSIGAADGGIGSGPDGGIEVRAGGRGDWRFGGRDGGRDRGDVLRVFLIAIREAGGHPGRGATGGVSAGTTGGHSKDPNAATGGSSGPQQSAKPANQSTAPEKKIEEPNQSKDPNQSKKEPNQSTAGRPPDDSPGTGGPASANGRPADDSNGGGTPYSSSYRPADDGGPIGPALNLARLRNLPFVR